MFWTKFHCIAHLNFSRRWWFYECSKSFRHARLSIAFYNLLWIYGSILPFTPWPLSGLYYLLLARNHHAPLLCISLGVSRSRTLSFFITSTLFPTVNISRSSGWKFPKHFYASSCISSGAMKNVRKMENSIGAGQQHSDSAQHILAPFSLLLFYLFGLEGVYLMGASSTKKKNSWEGRTNVWWFLERKQEFHGEMEIIGKADQVDKVLVEYLNKQNLRTANY